MAIAQPAPKPPAGVIQPLCGMAHAWKNNLQRLARNRGWPYVVAWAHRFAGVLLIVYAGAHILTLSALHQPERFTAHMRFFGFFPFRCFGMGSGPAGDLPRPQRRTVASI
jgi:hypothetical protein